MVRVKVPRCPRHHALRHPPEQDMVAVPWGDLAVSPQSPTCLRRGPQHHPDPIPPSCTCSKPPEQRVLCAPGTLPAPAPQGHPPRVCGFPPGLSLRHTQACTSPLLQKLSAPQGTRCCRRFCWPNALCPGGLWQTANNHRASRSRSRSSCSVLILTPPAPCPLLNLTFPPAWCHIPLVRSLSCLPPARSTSSAFKQERGCSGGALPEVPPPPACSPTGTSPFQGPGNLG